MASIWEEKEKIREDRLKIPRANFDISFISVENDGSLGKIFFFIPFLDGDACHARCEITGSLRKEPVVWGKCSLRAEAWLSFLFTLCVNSRFSVLPNKTCHPQLKLDCQKEEKETRYRNEQERKNMEFIRVLTTHAFPRNFNQLSKPCS